MWHVHGSWSTAFVAGRHRTLVPVDADRSPDGRGRARTWTWPERAVEIIEAGAEPLRELVGAMHSKLLLQALHRQ